MGSITADRFYFDEAGDCAELKIHLSDGKIIKIQMVEEMSIKDFKEELLRIAGKLNSIEHDAKVENVFY